MNSVVLKFKDGMTSTGQVGVELTSGIAEVIMFRGKAFIFEGTEDDVFYYHEASVVSI